MQSGDSLSGSPLSPERGFTGRLLSRGGEGEIYRVCYHDRFDGFFTDRKKAFSSLVQGLARRNDDEAIYVDLDGFSSVRSIYFFIGDMGDKNA